MGLWELWREIDKGKHRFNIVNKNQLEYDKNEQLTANNTWGEIWNNQKGGCP